MMSKVSQGLIAACILAFTGMLSYYLNMPVDIKAIVVYLKKTSAARSRGGDAIPDASTERDEKLFFS